ncbi:mCG147915 [Mus musculus]|jgi:hypothetical protein|nr:mCG147915 [Mus musculus]
MGHPEAGRYRLSNKDLSIMDRRLAIFVPKYILIVYLQLYLLYFIINYGSAKVYFICVCILFMNLSIE